MPDTVTPISIENGVVKPSKLWTSHRYAWTEVPALWPIAGIVRFWIRLRDSVLRTGPFLWSVPIPCIKHADRNFSLVEVLFVLIVLASIVAFGVITCVQHALDDEVEATGVVAMWPTAITFVLASRNSLVTLILGIPFERQLVWHKFFGWVTIAFGLIHGWLATWGPEQDREDDDFPSGWVFQGAMMGLVLTSLVPIRRKLWNFFYLFHLVLIVVTIVAGVIHEATLIMAGVMLWALDLLIRYVYMAALAYPHKCEAARLPANVVRLTFDKGKRFRYSPGQYVFIMVPKVNIFEWHPFSISSAPQADKVSLHIRVLGNWSKTLHDVITSKTGENITTYIEGPYGAPMLDIASDRYKLFLLISGGIGITPMQSICNYLLHEHEHEGRPMKKIWFVWSCADKYMVSAAFEHDRQWAGQLNRLPTSFQPDTIERIETDKRLLNRAKDKSVFDSKSGSSTENDDGKSESVLHTEFYLTRARQAADYEGANIHPHLQQHVRFGRPDIPVILMTMRNYALLCGEKRVAVLTCGPEPLVNDVRIMSAKESKDGVTFDFHNELFEF